MKGIDVSENNGVVDWGAVKAAGFEFAIIRIGYGKGHLDSQFYDNVNGATKAGLKSAFIIILMHYLTMWQVSRRILLFRRLKSAD